MTLSWEVLIYGTVILMIAVILAFYFRKLIRETKVSEKKIQKAEIDGLREPVSLYPVIDPDRCIRSGACVLACPEHDILGINEGRGTVINASQCIGHGACLRACPTYAISLWIGTEKRGVDIPEITPEFETNVPGIYIAGELGGMGLIRNAVKQGKEAVEYLTQKIHKNTDAEYDLVIVGAGPAGISASLQAKKAGINALTLEQDTLGGTVFTFPRSKIVMTAPMDLPLYGKVKFRETSKTELLTLWQNALKSNNLTIQENTKVESIVKTEQGLFEILTQDNRKITSQSVLIAVGRRGTPRKLNVPGEISEKVAYRLLEPEEISGKKVMVVGGGDSAIESALLLAEHNETTLSYRGDKFNRIKPLNAEKILNAIENKTINVLLNTQVKSIETDRIIINNNTTGDILNIENDLIYIFAGGELPTDFLKKAGIHISTKKGEVLLSNRQKLKK